MSIDLKKASSPKPKVNYCLGLIDRLGHLVEELCFLRNLYSTDDYDITVYVPALEAKPRTNREVLKIASQGMKVVPVADEQLVFSASTEHKDLTVVEENGEIWVFYDAEQLKLEFIRQTQKSPMRYFHSLSRRDLQRGLELRKSLNIPPTAPVVTVHARESGYAPEVLYHSFRNCSIDNLDSAIEFLLAEGYYIVRVGDSTMKPLNNNDSRVIDAPFHPRYTPFFDPYFVGTAAFHIGPPSGPYHIARSFARPILVSNGIISLNDWGNEKDVYLPKHYYSKQLGRELTYKEILFSPVVAFSKEEEFAAIGLELHENSPDEILSATKEMVSRTRDNYSADPKAIELEVTSRNIQADIHSYRGAKQLTPDFYGMYWSNMLLSHEYLKLNPHFVGHRW